MTDEFLNFNPLFNISWLLPILLLVTVLLIVLEWIKAKRFIIYRLLAISIAMISLAMLLFRPSYLTKDKSDQYLVLTPNYPTHVVDSLLQLHPELMVASYGDSSKRQSTPQIQTRQQLKDLDGKIAFIAGEGLSKSYFNLLQHKTFGFLPATKPIGIIEITLPINTFPGQWSSIKGRINIQEPTTLQLIDPAGKIDSINFNQTGEQDFTFLLLLKQAGNVLYTLQTITSSTEEKFSIPLKVSEREKLEILMLQLAPSFEIRQLKNFLAAQGHGIQIRSQLSKSNFSYEKVNTDKKQISTITNDVLKDYDLLILENATLEQLSRIESEAITKATNAGLGVLLLMNQQDNKNKYAKSLMDFSMMKDDRDTVHLWFYGTTKKQIIKKLKQTIEPKQHIIPVLVNANEILSAYRYQRFGKVAIQLLNETYQLRLAGDSTAYANIWSDLITLTSRQKINNTDITLTDEFPYNLKESIQFSVITNEEKPILYYEGKIAPLMEDVLIDNLWSAIIHPQKTGWNSVQLNDSTQYDFYVSSKEEWSALKQQQQLNLHQAETVGLNYSNHEKVSRYNDIPSYLFYLTFLLSMTFLWLAPKL
ncbi:hypothetical protein SanaruYs_02480 [Chryseotalea sanaruensis]|uniref:Aerotolerance regulator N-terminal domain-containing protein n=1 Tax=Chryseotalea sanaruensis TaxID=2482724 RepID=A0A401U527_9BACT|nr:hypothetical protein [Chryseotalea sanaruensis]GCC50033.1 hypothetical protein SanaruYs_02480 [Chryseotalea sanaruensis]